MNKIIISGLMGLVLSISLMAQQTGRPQISTEDRAKMTVDKIAGSVPLTAKQKTDMISIFNKFYDDVRAQKAFHDPAKLEPLEKNRDAQVQKLLNNKDLFRKYQDEMAGMKAQYQQRQGQQPKH